MSIDRNFVQTSRDSVWVLRLRNPKQPDLSTYLEVIDDHHISMAPRTRTGSDFLKEGLPPPLLNRAAITFVHRGLQLFYEKENA
jgi:hypothetical protein